jgi:hypothetical protein
MSIEAPAMNGGDVPILVDGKPTAGSMTITLIDDHHAMSVQKSGGKVVGTSKATLSPDFTTMTVENEFTTATAVHKIGKSTDVWLRK